MTIPDPDFARQWAILRGLPREDLEAYALGMAASSMMLAGLVVPDNAHTVGMELPVDLLGKEMADRISEVTLRVRQKSAEIKADLRAGTN